MSNFDSNTPDEDGLKSIWEKAIEDIFRDEPTDKGRVTGVFRELADKYGIEFAFSNGEVLGTPTTLNHRLENFSASTRVMTTDITDAIQENRFTREIANELAKRLMDEDRLLLSTEEELTKERHRTEALIEALVYLGMSKYNGEDENVSIQKDMMINDLKSYDLMLETFQMHLDFLDSYIERRPQIDRMLINLKEAAEKYIFRNMTESMYAHIEGYGEARERVEKQIRAAIDAKKEEKIMTSELREIIKVYKIIVLSRFESDGKQVVNVNNEALNECLELINNL